MITPTEFPYITSIHVNDCYTYQNFDIDLVKHQPFSHLILTGKNGSGKSTILKHIDNFIYQTQLNVKRENAADKVLVTKIVEVNKAIERKDLYHADLIKMSVEEHYKNEYKKISIKFSQEILPFFFKLKNTFYSFLLPYRNSKEIDDVNAPINQEKFEKELEDNSSSNFFIKSFKQFLVNKKVNQAFALLDNNKEEIEKIGVFFRNIEEIFGNIFEDNQLRLTFDKDNYEFFIELSDGRKLTFNILPDGFSAFLSILMDLFTRLDLIRKSVGNFTYDPCGIVLIDEPETHLHLSLQYQVLPILTKLFPNVQFIVATHSPAVISSIKNVTVFDLTSKEIMSDEAVGKSFSELMVSHFGLDNEFSSITDEIFDEFNTVLKETRNDIDLRKEKLKQLTIPKN